MGNLVSASLLRVNYLGEHLALRAGEGLMEPGTVGVYSRTNTTRSP